MEIAIAIFLGLWFVCAGIFATISVFKSFSDKK